ncbi:mitochondrial ribosomal protein S25-domain-containing protein [Gymnopilus junonius]|uniref:Small ribosomal subunit protein mS23 n=1 Tax=Gymnopilus junonius TaxID=109634 RepID=A0A9P5TVA1_GYMJU|nr:mitochondrial ribosomal protein S25-domain-containing protein [Gymnopilus junonius]
MGRRRIASQVHQQVSRLLRANYLRKEPVWYQAVLENPPLTLPPKAPPSRTAYDQKPQSFTKHSTRPLPIYYLEDDIRRQFFLDHPFETFRPTTLVEADRIEDPHPIDGDKWTRLGQRGRNPTPEDAVRFTLNLYQYHGLTLSQAYAKAIAQFRALRSEHHIATTFAVMEAEQLGSTFGNSEIENAFQREKRSLATWDRKEELDEGALAARKRWKAIVERQHGKGEWSKGVEYVKLWQEGSRPNYIPAISTSEEGPTSESMDLANLLTPTVPRS